MKIKKNTRLANTQKFSNHDKNRFLLFLRKGVYSNEQMEDWEKFSEKFCYSKLLQPPKHGIYD